MSPAPICASSRWMERAAAWVGAMTARAWRAVFAKSSECVLSLPGGTISGNSKV